MAAAVGVLQAGGLVALPTDTVYGVACLAQDSGAVRSIYSLKGRNGEKPLAICLGDVDRLYRWAPAGGARGPAVSGPVRGSGALVRYWRPRASGAARGAAAAGTGCGGSGRCARWAKL